MRRTHPQSLTLMDSHDIESYFLQHRKTLAVLCTAVGILAVSGFFMGMRQTENQGTRFDRTPRAGAEPVQAGDVPTAPKYAAIRDTSWLANKNWKFDLGTLPRALPVTTEAKTADPRETSAAVAKRKSLRAYDGAPPVIPHAIDTLSANACASCHGTGGNLVIGGTRPAEMSHPWITNCTSCHVPANGLREATAPPDSRLTIDNTFEGKPSAGKGPRAYQGAPPTMPHPVWMRQNCLACHGPGREIAIRSSHPQRRNCLQCHAPNSSFDNRETYLTNSKTAAAENPPPTNP